MDLNASHSKFSFFLLASRLNRLSPPEVIEIQSSDVDVSNASQRSTNESLKYTASKFASMNGNNHAQQRVQLQQLFKGCCGETNVQMPRYKSYFIRKKSNEMDRQ